MDDGQTPAAYRADQAIPAGRRPRAVSLGPFRIINFGKGPLKSVANQGRELPTGMNFSIRKEGHKIEGGPAAETRAAPE